MTSGGDADHSRIALQRGDIGTAAVTHPRTQAADELVNHCRHTSFVGDPSLDSLRHELLTALRVGIEVELVLEIPIAAAAPHGAERSHAAILLEAASLIENQFAGAF